MSHSSRGRGDHAVPGCSPPLPPTYPAGTGAFLRPLLPSTPWMGLPLLLIDIRHTAIAVHAYRTTATSTWAPHPTAVSRRCPPFSIWTFRLYMGDCLPVNHPASPSLSQFSCLTAWAGTRCDYTLPRFTFFPTCLHTLKARGCLSLNRMNLPHIRFSPLSRPAILLRSVPYLGGTSLSDVRPSCHSVTF